MDLLEETFDIHYDIALDGDTSLFDAIGQIDADEASIPVGNSCATFAADRTKPMSGRNEITR